MNNWIEKLAAESQAPETEQIQTVAFVIKASNSGLDLEKMENLLKNNGFDVHASVIPGSPLAQTEKVAEVTGDQIKLTAALTREKEVIIKTYNNLYTINKIEAAPGLVGTVTAVTPTHIEAEFNCNIDVEATDMNGNPTVTSYLLEKLELTPGQYEKI